MNCATVDRERSGQIAAGVEATYSNVLCRERLHTCCIEGSGSFDSCHPGANGRCQRALVLPSGQCLRRWTWPILGHRTWPVGAATTNRSWIAGQRPWTVCVMAGRPATGHRLSDVVTREVGGRSLRTRLHRLGKDICACFHRQMDINVTTALLGALAGAVIAGLFSIVVGSLQSGRDHDRWVRESRYVAYSDSARLRA